MPRTYDQARLEPDAQHNFVAAVALADEAYATDARRTDALATLGDANLALGRYDEAREAYARLATASASPAVLARLAHEAELFGRSDEAVRLLEAATHGALDAGELATNLAWYLVRLGEAYRLRGDIASAADYFEAELALDDDYYVALAALAGARAAQGDDAAALALYERAADIVPQPDILVALGDLYARHGRLDDARRQYETVMMAQALRPGTRDAKLLFHAGMIAAARGANDDARRWLTGALALNSHFDLLQAPLAQATLDDLSRVAAR